LFIRSFIYSEIYTFGLSKFSRIRLAFNIFIPIPVQEMVYLKAMHKKLPHWTFLCREPSIRKRIWKNLGGASDPLAPPGSAYDYLHAIYDLLIKNFISNVDFTLENF